MRMGERSGTSSCPHAQLLTLSKRPLAKSGESASLSSLFPPGHKDKTFPNPEPEVMEALQEKPEKAIEIY